MTSLLVFCSVVVSHALFWAITLLGMNQRLSNKLLSALLIVLSLRVGKSVLGLLLPEHMYFFAMVGLISMAEIGPILFLFTKSLFDTTFRLRKKDYIHLVPGIALLSIASLTDWDILNTTYRVVTASVMVYIVASAIHLYKNAESFKSDDTKWRWIIYILAGITALWVTFVCQLLFYQPLVYQLIVVTAAVVFYSLSWWAIPRSRLFIAEPRKKSSEIQPYEALGLRIRSMLEKEEIFTDPGLTVSTLAGRLKAPPYMVSRAVNQCFDKTFSELVMEYRIEKSKSLLAADATKNLTIEAVAFESGFNTLSAYYKAFKKINRITPAKFRENPRNIIIPR